MTTLDTNLPYDHVIGIVQGDQAQPKYAQTQGGVYRYYDASGAEASLSAVYGNMALISNATISGTLTVTSNVTHSGTTHLEGAVTADAALSVGTTLTVTGAATLSSTAHIVGAVTADAAVSVGTALTVGTSITLAKEVAHTMAVARSTTAATAGAAQTISAGGATSGSTDKAGGTLTLNGGIGTGTGESTVVIATAESSGTGTTDNTPVARITATGAKIGFFGHAAAAQPAANTAALTSITHTAPSSADYAIQDLVDTGGFGFATKDEGNSLLAVILNLQTRLAEMETKLKAVGLMAT